MATNSVLTHWTLISVSGCFGVESTMFKIQKGKKWKVDLQHQLKGHFFKMLNCLQAVFSTLLRVSRIYLIQDRSLSTKTLAYRLKHSMTGTPAWVRCFWPFLVKSRTVRWRNPRSGNWWGDSERGSITKEGEWSGQWVFGRIDRMTRQTFLIAVERRDKDTLLQIIKEQIKPNSTIIYDC